MLREKEHTTVSVNGPEGEIEQEHQTGRWRVTGNRRIETAELNPQN